MSRKRKIPPTDIEGRKMNKRATNIDASLLFSLMLERNNLLESGRLSKDQLKREKPNAASPDNPG
jgi:hypothetical protein